MKHPTEAQLNQRTAQELEAEQIYRDILEVDARICRLVEAGLIHGWDMAHVDTAAGRVLSALEPIAQLMHPDDRPE